MKWFSLRITRFFLLIFLFLSCTGPSSSPVDKKEVAGQSGFPEFIKNFVDLHLPFLLPQEKKAADDEINSEQISAFFAGKNFQFPFGKTKDIPDPGVNMESNHYFYVGKFERVQGVTVLLIEKETSDKDDYYYAATFSDSGEFIDGMCIAFREGTDKMAIERKGNIGDDFSIEIRQNGVGAEEGRTNGQSAFFELTSEGRIVPIKIKS
jgi:hypothetical protein